jgi:hypothetical protein
MLAVLAATNPEDIDSILKEKYPLDHIAVSPGQWLVSSDLTAQQMSDLLGITNGENGSGVVLAFVSYYGRANPQIWEWIATKMGALKRA